MNLDNCKLLQPLKEIQACESDERKPSCAMCGARFNVGWSLRWNGIGGLTRADYGLCMRHYLSAYYANDPAGRGAVEAALLKCVPRLYRDAEFDTFFGGRRASPR